MPGLSETQVEIVLYVFLALAVLTLLIDAVLFVAWAVRKDAVDAGMAPPLFAPRWSLVDVWIAGQMIVGLLIAVMVGIGILLAFAMLASGKKGAASYQMSLPLLLALLLAQNALMVAIPAGFITRKYKTPLRQIGLTLLPRARDWTLGLAGGMIMMGMALGLEIAINLLASFALPTGTFRSLTEWSKGLSAEQFVPEARRSLWTYALLFLGGAVAAPIGEEFFFRGFLYNAAKRRMGLLWGTILSAAVFALVHAGPVQVLAIFPMGVLLAVAYERTRSLWVPIIMHAVNNGTMFLYAYFAVRGG